MLSNVSGNSFISFWFRLRLQSYRTKGIQSEQELNLLMALEFTSVQVIKDTVMIAKPTIPVTNIQVMEDTAMIAKLTLCYI